MALTKIQTAGITDDAITAAKTTALPKEGGTMTGTINMADQILQRPELKDYSETKIGVAAAATVDLDMTSANVFTVTADQNTTFTFSNPPASGTGYSFVLHLVQDSSARTVTWPGSVDWAAATAPTAAPEPGRPGGLIGGRAALRAFRFRDPWVCNRIHLAPRTTFPRRRQSQ